MNSRMNKTPISGFRIRPLSLSEAVVVFSYYLANFVAFALCHYTIHCCHDVSLVWFILPFSPYVSIFPSSSVLPDIVFEQLTSFH